VAVVPIIPEGREVTPALLDRTIHLEVRNKKEEELLNIRRQLSQTTIELPFDPDLVLHDGHNITAGRRLRKSYLQKRTLRLTLARNAPSVQALVRAQHGRVVNGVKVPYGRTNVET
jgi:hypothetical protein